MSGSTNPDEGCGAFRGLPPGALKPRTIHRLIVGHDTQVKQLTQAEAAEKLGDPFATLLLLKGTFPNTAGDILDALDKATKPGDPLRKRLFFFVGEATQIPANERIDRHVRFLVTTGPGPEGPDLMFSVFHPDSEDAELIAWDRKAGGFNYRTTIGSNGWIFAGNSRHALEPESEFKGPFESHTSGNFLMKELKLPWVHWHSFSAPVTAAHLPPDLREHAAPGHHLSGRSRSGRPQAPPIAMPDYFARCPRCGVDPRSRRSRLAHHHAGQSHAGPPCRDRGRPR